MNPSNWFRRLYRESLQDAVKEIKAEIAKTREPRGDLVAGAREIIKSIDWDVRVLDEMPKQEREKLLVSAHQIAQEPALKYLIDKIIQEQTKYTIESGVEEKHYIAGRSVIMGVSLVREAIEKMNAKFMALDEQDDFDEDSLI